MAVKFRERLAVCKQAAKKFDVEKLNRRKRNELEVRKQYQIKVFKSFTALQNLNDNEDINRAWKNIKQKSKHQLN
jgi:DNA polymerase elongation subunit (family B)